VIKRRALTIHDFAYARKTALCYVTYRDSVLLGFTGFNFRLFNVCLSSFSATKMESARPLLTEEPAYKALLQYFNSDGKKLSMAQLFQQDPGRFNKFRSVHGVADLPFCGRSFWTGNAYWCNYNDHNITVLFSTHTFTIALCDASLYAKCHALLMVHYVTC